MQDVLHVGDCVEEPDAEGAVEEEEGDEEGGEVRDAEEGEGEDWGWGLRCGSGFAVVCGGVGGEAVFSVDCPGEEDAADHQGHGDVWSAPAVRGVAAVVDGKEDQDEAGDEEGGAEVVDFEGWVGSLCADRSGDEDEGRYEGDQD